MSAYRAIPDFYDAEYEHLDMLRHDVRFFMDRLPRRKRLSILELGAGTGRASIPLAQAGHRVVGIDFDADMLAIARSKRDSVGIRESDLRFVHADARNFKLRERFDCACIFFNTFLNFVTLDDQDAALSAARRHLKRKGKLWLDVFQPNLDLLAQPQSEDLAPSIFYIPSTGQTVFRVTSVVRDVANQLQHVTFTYRWFTESGVQRTRKVKFDLTWVFPREMQLLLERNGFEIDEIFGGYDGHALDDRSPRMIVAATRA